MQHQVVLWKELRFRIAGDYCPLGFFDRPQDLQQP